MRTSTIAVPSCPTSATPLDTGYDGSMPHTSGEGFAHEALAPISPPGARVGWRALSVCCVGLVGEEVIWMYDIGEKPGVGRYCCTSCGWSVNLDDGSDRLPPCGSCGKGPQTKYNSC
jgi:hypothetical protein